MKKIKGVGPFLFPAEGFNISTPQGLFDNNLGSDRLADLNAMQTTNPLIVRPLSGSTKIAL